MEKSSAKIRKLCVGLLAFVFVELFSFVMPQKAFGAVSWQYLQTLRFKKTEKYFFTSNDCSFSVNIENVSPDKVTAAVNDVPQGASFISLRKENYVPSNGSSDQYGTKLILTFRFNAAGSYQIRPVDVIVDGWYARISFESVYVYENPSIVHPRISVTFEDSRYTSTSRTLNMSAGQHLRFTLNIRYATQVYDFSWSIPENSLFIQTDSYDITRQAVNSDEFNPNTVPVATFDWQPLSEGEYRFPDFNVTAMSFGGIKYNVTVPTYKIKVGPASSARDSFDVDEETLYAYAFDVIEEHVDEQKKIISGTKDIDALLALHQNERHSIPIFSNARKLRRQAESDAGLTSQMWAPSIPVHIIIWSLAIILLGLTVLFFVLRRIPASAVCLAFCIAFAGLGIFYSRWFMQETALYRGGEIGQIPEYGATTGVDLPAGTVVQLKKHAGDWVYIRSNDTYGWVTFDKLLLIE